ncbi:unnamed protein product [Blepharisma stoltei]|uniref:Uncharacterized protein n=1 Tax=Blepharisma stoltei TaxID=1481888 RepID=A0AAU9K431_9CILI|nr:unnamed protein product [Blepharisma stoltei]
MTIALSPFSHVTVSYAYQGNIWSLELDQHMVPQSEGLKQKSVSLSLIQCVITHDLFLQAALKLADARMDRVSTYSCC